MFIDHHDSSPTTAVGAKPELSLGELEDRIATLAAGIAAADYQLLRYIAEFDERMGWWEQSFTSCAAWLSYRIGLNMRSARERVRVARALKDLPLVSDAMSLGELSYSKVRALTRVASEQRNEEDWLNLATRTTGHQLDKLVRMYRRVEHLDPEEVLTRHDRREFQIYYDEDGSVVMRGRMPPELGATVMKAVEYYRDQAFRKGENDGEEFVSSQADALVRMCEDVLAHEAKVNTETPYEVTVTVPHRTLQEAGPAEPPDNHATAQPPEEEPAIVEDSASVGSETARRICCDASVVPIVIDEDGSALRVGRKRRTIPAAMKRVLRRRDAGCRFPGCTQTRYVDGHHIEHWAQGGETCVENLVLLCRHHHRYVHEGGGTVGVVDGEFVFLTRAGNVIPHVGPPARVLEDHSGGTGLLSEVAKTMDASTMPLWEGGRVDYPYVVGAMLDAARSG